MNINKYIIFILILLFILLSILSFNLFFFYRKKILVDNILYAWKEKLKGNVTFDGMERYKNDYYLSLDSANNYSTHIHFITDAPNCYLCYIAKKNHNYSKLYIIDTNKEPSEIVDEMLNIFNKI